MDGTAKLVKQKYKKDELNQYVPNGIECREIFVTQESITRSEWATAGRNGYKPEIVLKTAKINYEGESEVEYEREMYSIYRTYATPGSDEIELYLAKKAGVQWQK